MSFPVNSYEVHAQRVLKYEGLAPEWNFGDPDETFCVERLNQWYYDVPPTDTVFFVSPTVSTFQVPAAPSLTKLPKESRTC